MPPNKFDILSTLVELLADQEGVKITYEITDGKKTVIRTTGERRFTTKREYEKGA